MHPLKKWESVLDLVVAGVLALPDGSSTPGEVGVRAGRIVAIAERGCLRGREHLDFGAALVLPGHVDAHVHSHSEPGEGFRGATAAAAMGGATTLVDVPGDDGDGLTTAAAVRRRIEDIEASALVDVALRGTVSSLAALDEVPAMMDAGVAAFQLATTSTDPARGGGLPEAEAYVALQQLAALDALVVFHPGEAACGENGWPSRSPPAAETEAIGRMLELALATGAHAHLCHLSVPRSFELVSRARADGADVTAETSTHYLLLDARDAVRDRGARCTPPLRAPMDREALWDLLTGGLVDFVTSDHVGWARAGYDDAGRSQAQGGFPGNELTLTLLFSEGVVSRDLPLGRLVKLLCENPARRLGLWPRKGAIAIGADADLVVLDPTARWRVDQARLRSAACWSPYHGRDVLGRVRAVFVRGCPVVEGGRLVGQPGMGRALGASGPRHALYA